MKYQRTLLADVEGYVPGEQPKMPNIVKLNTNENPYPPSPRVIEAVQGLTADKLRKYPDPLALELRTVCAEVYGVPGPEWIVVGNGMDELLALAMRTFVDPGDDVLSTYPTYVLYETLAQLHGARCVMVDLDDNFLLPESFYSTPARLCYLPRPNSPSGVSVPRAAVERLCSSFNGIVVIDEAYADFADDNCLDFPARFENAIVMRTFSKSYSLAGLRIGVAVARPEIIAEFMKTKDSYNMNAASQAAALAAVRDQVHMRANADRIRATRARTTDALRTLGFTVQDSQSNFLLAEWNGTPSARTLFERLREKAILVRYFNARRLDHALRISIGTDEEMQGLLDALRDAIES